MSLAQHRSQAEPAAGGARYSSVAVVLHWLIAAAILFQVELAWRMGGPHTPESFALIQLHKSVGITILLLSLARLGWRLANPPPPLPPTMGRWEAVLARAAHVGLYGIMIGMPLTGWLMVSASRTAIPTLLYGTLPWPNLPVAHLAPAAKKLWREVGEEGHGLLAWGLYGLFVLHVAGALKHQLFSRDEPVLARMAPGALAGRWADPRLLAIVAGLVVVALAGELVTPPAPSMAPKLRQAAAAPAPPPVRSQASPSAAPPPAVAATSKGPVPAAPVRWVVQPGSTLGFSTSWGGQVVQGRFDRWRADIVFSPDELARSKVSVTIDLASVDTGDAQRDATLPSPDWFDAADHPRAVFTATRFARTGPDRYLAHGVLQLRGVSRPQDLAFRLAIDGDKARANGSATLDRTAFGVGQGDFAATDQIPGKVSVTFALTALQAG